MIPKSSSYRVALTLADMDRHYYQTHALTMVRALTETEEHLMVRLLAFALHAHERLTFGRGARAPEDADLWQTDLAGEIDTWIEVGLPDERQILRARARARQVVIYSYGGASADAWWERIGNILACMDRVTVVKFTPATTAALVTHLKRSMRWHCTIEDGHVWLSTDQAMVSIERNFLVGA